MSCDFAILSLDKKLNSLFELQQSMNGDSSGEKFCKGGIKRKYQYGGGVPPWQDDRRRYMRGAQQAWNSDQDKAY